MGKETGFIEYPRVSVQYESVEKRITHYNEFTTRLPEEELELLGYKFTNISFELPSIAIRLSNSNQEVSFN